jgi:putative ATPase
MATITPLAELLRPKILNDVVGQQHLIGPGKPLRVLYEQGRMHSLILWGPPGVGKTTIVRILAEAGSLKVSYLSAVQAGVKDVRAVLDQAAESGETQVLFIDEIHRFNKSQQDALLASVEQGIIILAGATTENPSFEVNKALLSRCRVYTLEALTVQDLASLAQRALNSLPESQKLAPTEQAMAALLGLSTGDGRRLLNLIEILAEQFGTDIGYPVSAAEVGLVAQTSTQLYDKDGEQHYDIISAFIKSMRGSDPDAALFWMARMMEAGEKPEFIARRMLILAAEDIGLANPNALLLANAAYDAVLKIGWPESRIILGQCCVYLATSEKSNATYLAIGRAQELVAKNPNLPVPLHLRNAPTALMKKSGYGKGYKYSHDFPDGFVAQQYLPDALLGTTIYTPGHTKKEAEIARLQTARWGKKTDQTSQNQDGELGIGKSENGK